MSAPLPKIYWFLVNDYILLCIVLFSLSQSYTGTIIAVQLAFTEGLIFSQNFFYFPQKYLLPNVWEYLSLMKRKYSEVIS